METEKTNVEKEIKLLVDDVIRNHPNTILSTEQHTENIGKMIYNLNLYLNGNPKIQKKVRDMLEMWEKNN